MENNENPQPSWLEDRVVGIFILLVSLASGYYFIIQPIQSMLRQEQYIYSADKGIAISVLAFLLGASYLIFGKSKVEAFVLGSRTRTVILTIVVILLSLGAILGWGALANRLGYNF